MGKGRRVKPLDSRVSCLFSEGERRMPMTPEFLEWVSKQITRLLPKIRKRGEMGDFRNKSEGRS